MPERKVIVGSTGGLHARPAKVFVEAAARQPVAVSIRTADRGPVPARSMLSVLSLGAAHGTEVVLRADGEGAEAALSLLADLLARDLEAPEPTGPETAGPEPRAQAPQTHVSHTRQPHTRQPQAHDDGPHGGAGGQSTEEPADA